MENGAKTIMSNCDMFGVKPAVMALPYPPIQVQERNQNYADLISVSYCGAVSEMSAVMQYINNESRMFSQRCQMGRVILGMAMAEMSHMQILAELISLLGGKICYTSMQSGGQQWMWSPQCLTLPEKISEMLQADLEREMATIEQYNMQIRMIRDEYVNAVLNRIVQDEQYHIMLLRSMMDTV
ncbi:MAG: manganese catalase family protein [Lachnospiraceae bacterium]|nr:manganese catalase family protein [Lachnospiraceae bacterium]